MKYDTKNEALGDDIVLEQRISAARRIVRAEDPVPGLECGALPDIDTDEGKDAPGKVGTGPEPADVALDVETPPPAEALLEIQANKWIDPARTALSAAR